MATSLQLAKAGVAVAKLFREPGNEDIAFVGLAGTKHQKAAEEEGVRFIPGTDPLLFRKRLDLLKLGMIRMVR